MKTYEQPKKYVVLKHAYLNDMSISREGKKMLNRLDDMDVVDALHVVRDLESLLEWKHRERTNG